MGSDGREWTWWLECSGAVPEPFRGLGASEVPPGSGVFAVRAPRAVMDKELPSLLAAETVSRATCLEPPSPPPTRPWGRRGALVVDRRLAQRIWTAADILGGPWTLRRVKLPGSDAFFEDPVTMCWDDPDHVELTLEPRKVYGSGAWGSWRPPWPTYLTHMKERPDPDFEGDPVRVCSYLELVDRVAFLGVMNKTLNLLFRGQTSDDWVPKASIYRDKFTIVVEGGGKLCVKPGGENVKHYLDQLEGIEQVVYDVLKAKGLPRRRHLDPTSKRPAAIWAVIQHYELWPTPLLDFSTSLRVAATFAYGFDRDDQENLPSKGFVYVYGVPTLTSDLMQPTGSSLAVRLNSVCPPGAQRPHLQDGVLVGRGARALAIADPSVAAIPLAKLHLDNSDGGFWDNRDFPPLSEGSLLPHSDDLRDELRQSLRYDCDDKGKCLVSKRR